MALTGHFDADFSSFYAACTNAQIAVKGFQGDVDVVNKSLTRMTDEFTGRKVISEATLMVAALDEIGGVSKLTAAELQRMGDVTSAAIEKMKLRGDEVPPSFQAIADAAKQADSGLANFAKDFNIKEAISDPLATAGSAVQALAESMGPGAVAMAGYASGILAVEAALFKVTYDAAEVGAHLQDVNDVTGIAVPRLSQLATAATVAGTDLGTLNNAVFQMNKQMELSPDKFNDGLKRLNLNAAEFKAMAPEDRFQVFTEALGATSDAAERTAAGSEIMGKQFRDIEPALLKMNDALQMTADIRPWTEQEAKDAEAFVMELESLKVHAESLATAFGRGLIGPIEGFVSAIGSVKGALDDLMPSWMYYAGPGAVLESMKQGWSNITTTLGYGQAAWETLRGTAATLPPVLDDVAEKLKKLKQAQADAFDKANRPDLYLASIKNDLKDLQLVMPSAEDGFRALAEVERDLDPVTKEHAKSTKELNDAFAEVASAGDGWKGTLDTIDGAVVESIISYRDAGVSMQALGKIYSDLSDTQKASIEKERTARTDAVKQAEKDLQDQAKLEAKTIDETTKLWDQYEVERVKQMGTVTDIARAENDKQYADASANANKMGIVDTQYWDALEARWKQKNAAIGVDWAALTNAATTQSKAGLQQIADGAAATYKEALTHVGVWSDSSIDKFRTTAEAAQKAADMFGTSWKENADKAKKGVDDMADDTIGQIHAIAAASASAKIAPGATQPYPDTAEGRLKQLADEQARYGPGTVINTSGLFGGLRGFAEGGSGDFGSGTPVMLHGKEAIIPIDGPSATGASGARVTQNIYITQPLGTPEAIARVVADAQVQLMRGQGVRLPYGT